MMKKTVYLFILISLIFAGCSNDNEEDHIYKVRYVDLSSLSIHAGSDNGAEKVQYNNLKRTELARHYFGTLYNRGLYNSYTVQFYGDLITYEYLQSNNNTRKIVSKYTYSRDSLYAIKTNGDYLFVALGSHRDSLYRIKSLVRYPYKTPQNTYRDTVVLSDKAFDYKKDLASLPLTKYTSLDDLKAKEDTIVWCNAIYLFQ